ncbi:MAG: electron transfer flavoprotein subunit beta [Planctomycetota bacterium]|nr:MAG: electron transfer flavoprotein subunit beta [Planctomycetota bacterium]
MHIVVLIKRVPDTASKITIAADGRTIETAGLQFVLNPYDEFAIEAALQLKEQVGAGTVTVMTLGPAEAAQTLRSALAMGADRGVHLEHEQQLGDPYAIARTLATAIQGLAPPADLVLAGRQAVDSQSLAVGPMVASLLELPCVTDVTRLERQPEGKLRVEREVEGGHEVLLVEPPALLTTNKGLNEPRYASLKGIMAAKKKPIEEPAVPIAPALSAILRLEYPPARQGGRIVGEGAAAVPELVRLLREEAKVL